MLFSGLPSFVYQSEVALRNASPRWEPIEKSLQTLCSGPDTSTGKELRETPLVFEVFHQPADRPEGK